LQKAAWSVAQKDAQKKFCVLGVEDTGRASLRIRAEKRASKVALLCEKIPASLVEE